MNKIINRANTTVEEQIGDSKVEHSRLEIWSHALELLKRHPFIGIGLTELDYRLRARREIGGSYEYRKGTRKTVSGFMDQPHNSYISLALWVSPFSLIIFLMMNFRVLKLGRKVIKNPDAQAYYKLFSFSAGVAIFCYLVVIFFDTQLLVRTVNSLYWLLFGLLISVYRRVESEKTILTA
jgi:O-antigen ligase